MKYIISGSMTVSCYTEVEADSPEEALQIAAIRQVAEHHIDGSYPGNESWLFENDGTPFDLKIEDES